MLKVSYLSDVGLKRKVNEDSILIGENNNIFIISDGMGGHYRGDVASQLIVQTFQENFLETNETEVTVPDIGFDNDSVVENIKFTINKQLNNSIQESTKKIITFAKDNELKGNMGATIVGFYQSTNIKELAIFHLGDSKGYRIRNNKIEELTIDHSEYEEKKRNSNLTEEELSNVSKSKITKAIGNFNAFELTINYTKIIKNDIYILCSDGISDLCEKEEILDSIQLNDNDLEATIEDIKNMIYSRGARDNLSLIIIQY